MKTILFLILFSVSTTVSAQLLQQPKVELKKSAIIFENQDYKTLFSLKEDLNQMRFLKIDYDQMRSGFFIIDIKQFNLHNSYTEIPTLSLKKELLKVMHPIPGISQPIDYDSFRNLNN